MKSFSATTAEWTHVSTAIRFRLHRRGFSREKRGVRRRSIKTLPKSPARVAGIDSNPGGFAQTQPPRENVNSGNWLREGILLHQLALNESMSPGLNPAKAPPSEPGQSSQCDDRHFPEDCPPGPFDAIILSHFLEHLEKPGEVLRELATRNPNAIILLAQTNFRALPADSKHKWYAWHPSSIFGISRNKESPTSHETRAFLSDQSPTHRFAINRSFTAS